MRRRWTDMNPTVRGFLIILLIAAAIWALSLETTLTSLFLIVRIAFFLAIAFVLYLLWRDRVREDAAGWSRRARATFYGAAFLILAALAVVFSPWVDLRGLDALALVLVLGFSGFALWRVWRDEHTYRY